MFEWKSLMGEPLVELEHRADVAIEPDDHLPKGDPPELPPIIEQERQPPRKGSNLTYKRLQLPNGVEVSVMAKPGRVIDEVIRFEPKDGTDPIIKIITRRVRGRPTKQQTNGSGNGADHGVV
jgi:hypothetical protein